MATRQETELQQMETEAEKRHCAAEPKWAALVDDRAIPMPQQVVNAQVVKDQAGIGPKFVLVRDYQSRNDQVLADDAELDLALGNVFRVIPRCEGAMPPPCHEPAKLAFFVDDEWEVTVEPDQSGLTMRRLFALPQDVELLRDFESPQDEPIADEERIQFADGPVFRTGRITITVKVNNQPVTFHRRRVTGLDIKQTAIAQGVAIKPDFVLYAMKPNGELGPVIRDDEKVNLKKCDEFRCVAPDDNS